jgi:hypothetical protein
MSGSALVFMILVGGFVWGGFVLLLLGAMRRGAEKSTRAGS